MGDSRTGRLTSRELLVDSCKTRNIPFSEAEYRSRRRRVQEIMRAEGLDILYLSAPESLFYLSGYRAEWYQTQSPAEWPPLSGIAIHAELPNFILFDSADEELMVRSETCARDIRIMPNDGLDAWVDWIVGELTEEGWVPSTVGLEMGCYRPNRLVSEAFQRGLEKCGCKVVDATRVVRQVRSRKSPGEIKCVVKASMIADIGFEAALEFMRTGVTELQVYGEVIRAMSDAGGENPGITIPVISGDRSARSHALASRRKIRRGDIVNIDICGVYNRYHSNHARTFSIGKPDIETRRILEVSAGAFELARTVLKPNDRVIGFIEKMKNYYLANGVYDDRMWFGGYELGIAFPPDWVGPFVYDENLGLDEVFSQGTAVNYESNFYLPHKKGASLLINTIVFDSRKVRILGKTPNSVLVV